MSLYRQQVVAALGAVTVCGPTQYTWLGRRSRRLPGALDADLDASEHRRYLVSCLREELYCSFYCHGRPVTARWGEPQPAWADPWLQTAISRANHSRGSWEVGWTVQRVDDGEVVVASPRLRVRVPVGDCEGRLRPGGAVRVRLPKELPSYSPGYCTVLGDTVAAASPEVTVRVYWNVTRGGAPALVDALTSWLNRERVPFRLKVADHPFRLERCDAAVLYVDGEVFTAIRAGLGELARNLSPHLRREIPAFTLALAPGVGLAEDADGQSFGTQRCALLADGIVRAHEQGVAEIGARVEAVVARFAEEGVAIDSPYLEPSLEGRHVLC
jgi:hypothetical protein